MFCTSLRRRSSFASALPSLTSDSKLALKESQLDTHDISLPLPAHAGLTNNGKPKQQSLRFLLLSPSSVADNKLAATLSRIHHFASLTGGVDIALVMLLAPPPGMTTARSLLHPSPEDDDTRGVHAYARLQAEVFSLTDLAYLPILPLAGVGGLAELLRSYRDVVSQGGPRKQVRTAVTAVELLPYCTTEPPLPPFAVDLVTDVFSSLGHLASEATSLRTVGIVPEHELIQSVVTSETGGLGDDLQPGLSMLRCQLGEEVVDGMVRYWEDEWTTE